MSSYCCVKHRHKHRMLYTVIRFELCYTAGNSSSGCSNGGGDGNKDNDANEQIKIKIKYTNKERNHGKKRLIQPQKYERMNSQK